MKDVLKFNYNKGVKEIFPCHDYVKNWLFNEGEEDEAALAHQLAVLAEKEGVSANQLSHLFPAILRMFGNKSSWTK
jgi:hypothetical protein